VERVPGGSADVQVISKRKALVFAIVVFVAALIGTVAVRNVFHDLCGNDLIQEVQSPDGQLVATTFDRGCGATTRTIRMVVIRSAGETFEFKPETTSVYSSEGANRLHIAWRGVRTLALETDNCGSGIHVEKRWRDVNVTCVETK
jgi:hypothetical protein